MSTVTLLSLATASPSHVVRQDEAKRLVASIFAVAPVGAVPGGAAQDIGADADADTDADWSRLVAVFDHGAIDTRRTCMPPTWYAEPHGFRERNECYVEHATRLGIQASRRALERAGLGPRDVDHVVFVSSTGLATPSIDALLANEMGLSPRVRRTPIWGLGCAGGAAGLARASAFAAAAPGSRVLLVTVELCSLTFQAGDRTKRNLVAASLFADGAAAALLTAGARRGSAIERRPCEIVASGSTFWPRTLEVMGWEIDGDGLHVVFSRDIPAIVRERVRPALEAFLADADLGLDDVRHFAAHPGGVKVLDAYRDALELSEDSVRHARTVLRDHGNMSAPTCLFVLERMLDGDEIAPGDHALVTALGPGFGAEYVLLRGGGASPPRRRVPR